MIPYLLTNLGVHQNEDWSRFKESQCINYDKQLPLMVTWASRLHGVNILMTVREVRKQLNYLTPNKV